MLTQMAMTCPLLIEVNPIMKFIIHLHETEDIHYDLMLENEDSLMTWRIGRNDFERFLNGAETWAERINDHRKFYLTYQGPVSSGRGTVISYDTGDYTVKSWDGKTIEIAMVGAKIHGSLSIFEADKAVSILNFFKNF